MADEVSPTRPDTPLNTSGSDPGARAHGLAAMLVLVLLAGGAVLVYWRVVLTNRVLGTGDAFAYFTPYRAFANAALRDGHLPLWNPYLFLGVPFLANPQAAVLYPLHWPFLWLSAAKSLIASSVLHVWLAGVGTYIYVRRVPGLAPIPSLVAALIFSLGGFLGAHIGQVNQISVVIWLPWLLWLLEEAAGRGQRVAGGTAGFDLVALAGMALAVGLQFLAGHTQSSYINLVGLGTAALWPGLAVVLGWASLRVRRQPAAIEVAALRNAVRRLLLVIAATVLGTMLAAVQLLPSWELAQSSVRSGGLPYREAVSFSLRPAGLLLSLLPSFGEDLGQLFGTPAYAEFVAYVGVSTLVLAVLGLIVARDTDGSDGFLRSWAGLAAAFSALGLGLALGAYNPLYFVLYKLVPGFDLFRAPARWMALYAFGFSVLAAYGLAGVQASRVALSNGWRSLASRGLWWRSMSWKRRVAVVLASGLGLAFLAWQRWPQPLTVILWLLIGAAVVALVLWRPVRWWPALLVGVVLAELAGASLALDHTRPTAPEAITSLRTAPGHLLAVAQQELEAGQIPGRYLSMSGITYDPGDLAEIEQIFAGQLPPEAVYDFLVDTKLQEIVAPNLPLFWRLPAVDGYDGGVLPLRRYVDLQSLFIPPEQLAPDGRLREQLQAVPPSRLLNLLNVAHVITDKGFDVWMDDVYYDLELSTVLDSANSEAVISSADRLEATALGVFTHLEGGTALANGVPVAEVVVTAADDSRQSFTLRAGEDTAEGKWQETLAHIQPSARSPWPRNQAGWDYLALLPLDAPISPEEILVRHLAPEGEVVLRAISLIDERTGAHASLTMPADGNFQRVHSGDVKVYRNQELLPRAYVVNEVHVVEDDRGALAVLGETDFDPRRTVVLIATDLEQQGLSPMAVDLPPVTGQATLEVVRYEPEQIDLRVHLPSDGVLVLSDTWYPGWEALVDGVPSPILRANLLFRAMVLQAGSHEVGLRFRPASLRVGAMVSLTGLVVLVALLLAGLARGRRPADGS